MKNLKILRESLGISQQRLAEQFCLSQQSIYKYEKGLAEPDFSTLIQLADYFHTSVDYLIGHECNEDSQSATPDNIKEVHHLALYRKLPQTTQQALDTMLESIFDSLGTNK